jgi:hypothetical protein
MRLPIELLLAICVVATGGLVFAVSRRWSGRKDPELRRSELIERHGRLIEGNVLDYDDGVIVYSWSWRGVEYEASQDVRQLAHRLPVSADALVGPVTVKFLPGNPANSIVVSERWSGLGNRDSNAQTRHK